MLFLAFFVTVAMGNAGLGYASFVVLRRRLAQDAGTQRLQPSNDARPNRGAGE